MNKDETMRRTKAFAVGVVKTVRPLPRSAEAAIMVRQLVRSGTSVGANYRSACMARSKADFVAELCIVAEEDHELTAICRASIKTARHQ